MTKQISNLVVCVFCIGFLVACSGTPGMAADKAKYSGKYSLQGRKTASGNKIDSTIEVIQSDDHRSEEHTSELQSRLHLVCRLLLEKKKSKKHTLNIDALASQSEFITIVFDTKPTHFSSNSTY